MIPRHAGVCGRASGSPSAALAPGLDPPRCWWDRPCPEHPAGGPGPWGAHGDGSVGGTRGEGAAAFALEASGLGRGGVHSWGLVGRRMTRSKTGCRICQLCLSRSLLSVCKPSQVHNLASLSFFFFSRNSKRHTFVTKTLLPNSQLLLLSTGLLKLFD